MLLLTIVRIAIKSNGNFRPNLLVTKPNMIFPTRPPAHVSDAIHDDSSVVIFPEGNGVASDASIGRDKDVHEHDTPYAMLSKFTK